MVKLLKIFFVITIILTTLHFAQSREIEYFELSPDSLNERGEIYTGKNWKYNPGDDIKWAEIDFDDSSWERVTSTLNTFELPEKEFPGIAWFRLHIKVDSSLINKPLSFDFWLAGAADVFINGEHVFSYGNITDAGETQNYVPEFPKIISFIQKYNLIAVRYHNDKYPEMHQKSFTPGFILELGYPTDSIINRYDSLIEYITMTNIFVTISLVLALLHFFLFIFDGSNKQNLFYVLFLIFFSFFIYITMNQFYGKDIYNIFTLARFAPTALIFTILFGSTTIKSIYTKIGSSYKYIVLVGVVLSALGFILRSEWIWYAIYTYITGVSIWGSNVLYNPKFSRNLSSDWIIRIGFALMGISGISQMLLSLGFIGPIFGIYIPFVYGVVIFILSMSIALAHDYVTTSKNLKQKLVEVNELSEITLKQELEAKELDIQRRILEADNKRKTDELEAARTVQLAMLPQCLNDIEGLDICFEMLTATEVGGDYYDYKISEDGTLNLVVGDATGHGMKAGIMVASIKSLFSALGMKMMIPDFFKKCTEIIKSMSLGNLFMSMAFIRIKGISVIGSLSGMPPILIYRKDKNIIEEILQKSMPLGAYLDFPYENFQTEIQCGDVILIMSDGYLELFNAQKEMLGEEKLKSHFLSVAADKNANDIVSFLLEKGKEWRKDHPQEDDITFVAIKKK